MSYDGTINSQNKGWVENMLYGPGSDWHVVNTDKGGKETWAPKGKSWYDVQKGNAGSWSRDPSKGFYPGNNGVGYTGAPGGASNMRFPWQFSPGKNGQQTLADVFGGGGTGDPTDVKTSVPVKDLYSKTDIQKKKNRIRDDAYRQANTYEVGKQFMRPGASFGGADTRTQNQIAEMMGMGLKNANMAELQMGQENAAHRLAAQVAREKEAMGMIGAKQDRFGIASQNESIMANLYNLMSQVMNQNIPFA